MNVQQTRSRPAPRAVLHPLAAQKVRAILGDRCSESPFCSPPVETPPLTGHIGGALAVRPKWLETLRTPDGLRLLIHDGQVVACEPPRNSRLASFLTEISEEEEWS